MIVFIAGGVRSGKSRVAEQAALALHADSPSSQLWYLATARSSDREMAARVARHRARRDRHWRTLEAPLQLLDPWRTVAPGDSVLLDCLTLWTSQRLFADGIDPGSRRQAARLAQAELAAVLADARQRDIHLVVVSNDLNEELPAQDALVRWYVRELQRLHRLLARRADRVIEVVAGQMIEWQVVAGSGQDQ